MIDEFWSVQLRLNGTWITEAFRLQDRDEALFLALDIKASRANSPRVRINRHVTYHEEV